MDISTIIILVVMGLLFIAYRRQQASNTSEDRQRVEAIKQARIASLQQNSQHHQIRLPVPRKLLFLDIDGILHPGQSNTLEHAEALVSWLEGQRDVGVILSSSWRIGATFETLPSLIGEELSRYIYGMTAAGQDDLPNRESEILHFVATARPDIFLALDDTPRLFPSRPAWLHVVDGSQGLSADDFRKMDHVFKQIDLRHWAAVN